MYNIIGFILAGFGMLTPVLAVIFQEAGCITVVFSSTLLLWAKTGPLLKNTTARSSSSVSMAVESTTKKSVPECA
jgi:hypothetical protein